jgi:transcriptional regulator with XRE-family HTH domain
MTLGERIRQLRLSKKLTLRDLAAKVGVGFTYLSRVETGNMTSGEFPSEALIHRLAETLEANEQSLLLLARKIPELIRNRVLQRPDAFLAFASCDDATLDSLMRHIGEIPKSPRSIRRRGR